MSNTATRASDSAVAVRPPLIDLPVNRNLHDPIANPRNQRGDRLSIGGTSSVPVVSLLPVEATELRETIEEIRAVSPALAGLTAHYYNRRLLESETQYQAIVSDIYAAFQARQQFIAAHNEHLAAQSAEITLRTAALCQPLEVQLAKVESVLSQAHLIAGKACGAAYVPYFPGTTTATDILSVTPLSLEILAGQIDMPYDARERNGPFAPYVLTVLCIIVGALTGVSLGLITRNLHAGRLFDDLLTFLFWAVSGSGLVFALKCAVEGLWGRVGIFSLKPFYFSQWMRCALAMTLTGGFVVAEATLEKIGLMLLRAASHGSAAIPGADSLTLYAAPFLIAGPLIVVAAVTGICTKRTAVVENRLFCLQQQKQVEFQEQLRSDPNVQSALTALATVACYSREEHALREKIELLKAAGTEAEAEIAKACRPLEDGLSLKEQQLIQDAHDQTNGTQLRFDALLEAVLKATHGHRWIRKTRDRRNSEPRRFSWLWR